MSKAVEEDDEKRLYQCVRKYEKIVKQFDELIEIMDARSRPPKRRRYIFDKSSGGSSPAPDAASQPDNNEGLVQTVTRFLQELNPNRTDPNSTTSTHHQH